MAGTKKAPIRIPGRKLTAYYENKSQTDQVYAPSLFNGLKLLCTVCKKTGIRINGELWLMKGNRAHINV
jgi:hypothetical protein